ncbi:methyl-accepting chemotaxis protein [Vibrio sp. SCSIO 43136]|uniref:methyl-accepting chemotaxis protein n=1 Tax=Vibrio sp. SCSIO 43136 TaxID=2819101 RepID=UPI002075D214|nr:methyl-accepting chemotaxis protein [Vibrio sp. SCSIO 43136]USD67004.1 methyl-accepting chemotaxis protein [Vibrio sp. SCSIO 43136]
MQWIKDQTISRKVLALVAALVLMLVICAGYAINKMNIIGYEITGIAEENMPLVQLTSEITINQLESAILVEKAMRYAGLTGQHTDQEIVMLQDEAHSIGLRIDEKLLIAKQLLSTAITHAFTEEMRREEEELLRQLDVIISHHKTYEEHAMALLNESRSGLSMQLLDKKVTELEKEQANFNHELEAFLLALEELTHKALLYTQAEEQNALEGMIFLTLISALFGMGFGVAFSRNVVIPLKRAAKLANSMANGDFSKQITADSKDEVGQLVQAMGSMSEKLNQTITEVLSSSQDIHQLTLQLAQAAQTNQSAMEEQQMNTEQVATAMSEMAATVTQVASSANSASDVTDSAEKTVQQGHQVVSASESSNDSLNQISHESAQKMAQVNTSSQEIGGIIQVINGIAEQTNLLALNAAIEAARAGEQGRGFAVVADEVRALASRTQEATGQIDSLITGLQQHTEAAVQTVQQSQQYVEQSIQQAGETKESFNLIRDLVDEISQMNSQIAAASEEQSVVAEQISQNLEGIKESGFEVTKGANVTAESSRALESQSQRLNALMAQFKV